jgi:hypothetical protein
MARNVDSTLVGETKPNLAIGLNYISSFQVEKKQCWMGDYKEASFPRE